MGAGRRIGPSGRVWCHVAYNRAIADRLLGMMAEGCTLKEACRTLRAENPTAPAAPTVRDWVVQDIDGIAERYARARDALMMHWADEIVEAADDATNDYVTRLRRDGIPEVALDREHVQRSALRVDARKWLLSKLHPQFAEKIRQEHTGANGGPIQTQQVEDGRVPVQTFLDEFTRQENENVPTKH